MTVQHIEHVISTPSGMRVLTEIEPEKGFAMIRQGFGPDDMSISAQRLQINNAFDQVHVAEDGTWINPRMLWSILVQMAKPNQPLKLDDTAALLFYPQVRPDLHRLLMKLFESFDPADPYWSAMAHFGCYNPNSRTVHRIPKHQPQGI